MYPRALSRSHRIKLYDEFDMKMLSPYGSIPGLVFYADPYTGLYARGPFQGVGTFTNADASNRWFQDPYTGLYRAASANEIRVVRGTDGKLAWLLEPAATQLLTGTMPTTFTAAAGWTHANLAATPISSDGAIGPTGAMEMDGIIGDNTNAAHTCSSALYARTNNVPYSWSIFLRPGDKSFSRVQLNYYTALDAFVSKVFCDFSLSGSGSAGTTSSGVTASITKIVDGLYLCQIRHTLDFAAATKIQASVRACDADNDETYTGDNTTVNLWGYGAYLRQTAFFDQPIFTGSATRTTEAGSLTFPVNAATAAALGTGGRGTVLVRARFANSSACLPSNGNSITLFSTGGASSLPVYLQNNAGTINAKSYDGTNTCNVAITWAAGDDILFASTWDAAANERVVSYEKNQSGTVSSGTAVFDGDWATTAIGVGTALYYDAPATIQSIKAFNRVLSAQEKRQRGWN